MKKYISILLSMILSGLILCGCGKTDEPEQKPDLIKVGFSQVGSESSWRLANTDSMISAFSEENGFELIYDNAKQKQSNQFLAIRNFIQQEVDYIILAPIAESGWDNVLQEAKNAGIPVIIVDRQVKVKDDSLYVSWVGSDFFKEGRNAVQWLEVQMAIRGKSYAPLRILHLQGTEGATAQILRSRALNVAVAANSHWEIVGVLQGEYTEAKAYEQVRDFIQSGTHFDVIYSENDNMTFGAIKALDEAGITHGQNGDVMIITFDAVNKALDKLLNGEVNLCVECNPMHGPRVEKIIRMLEAGETPDKLVYVDETWFSKNEISREILEKRPY